MQDKKQIVDWSKHELIVEDHETSKIWRLKKPGTCCKQVNFINTENRLLITGDYGDWLFCREFHPSPEGHVSNSYWMEKMQMSMGRREWGLDVEATEQAIKEFPERYTDDDLPVPEEVTEWLEDLKNNIYDKMDYMHCAFRETPSNIDYNEVPFCKEVPIQIDIVFEAFDEICRRLKEQETLKGDQ